jgi:hypothetical protein
MQRVVRNRNSLPNGKEQSKRAVLKRLEPKVDKLYENYSKEQARRARRVWEDMIRV